jgi:hypothetical protein
MKRGAGALVALVAVAAAVCPSVARAQAELTLTGENGDSAVTSASLTCSTTSSGVLTYDAVGTATGPYPGTYEEKGTFRYDNGTVTSFNATFTIDSPVGHVQGQKTLELGQDATCFLFETGQTVQAAGFTRYDATITTATGMFHDHGSGLSSGTATTRTSGAFSGTVSATYNSDRETASITLTPGESVDPIGTTHTVTATVVGGTVQQPLAGITVYFTVSGSVNMTGQCTTDQTGQCSFTYQGPDLPGSDLIEAYADANNNGIEDPSEVPGSATKEWVLPAATPGQTTGGGQILWVTGKVVFGFNAQNQNGKLKGNCNVIDVTSRLHIKCLTVTSLVISGTHATFFGEATVNGVATNYRIDVDDLAEPGTGDTFKIQTDSGYTASGVLTAGNIQVRP